MDKNTLGDLREKGASQRARLLGDAGDVELSGDDVRDLVTISWASSLGDLKGAATPELRQAQAIALGRVLTLLPSRARLELSAALCSTRGRAPGLGAVLDLDDDEVFVSEYWPDRVYVNHGPKERFDDFLCSDVNELLRMPSSVIRALSRTVGHAPVALPISHPQVVPLYDAGFTIHFHGLVLPSFSGWLRAIEARLGLVAGTAALGCFVSRSGLGVVSHYDVNDNIVIQIKGTKRWKLAPNAHVKWPTLGYVTKTPASAPHLVEAMSDWPSEMPDDHRTVELRAGSVMFVPRGYWHECETVDEESMHFNIQCGLTTRRDIVLAAVFEKVLRSDVEMRRRVSNMFEDGVLRSEIRKDVLLRLRSVVDALTEADLAVTESELATVMASRARPQL